MRPEPGSSILGERVTTMLISPSDLLRIRKQNDPEWTDAPERIHISLDGTRPNRRVSDQTRRSAGMNDRKQGGIQHSTEEGGQVQAAARIPDSTIRDMWNVDWN